MISAVNRKTILYLLSGVLCVVLGCFLVKFRPQEFMINYIFAFHEGGEVYKWWLNSSAAGVYLKAYAFNITNPTEFMAGREKMKLQEVGPFVYREKLAQVDAVFNDNGTVTSKPKYEAIWDPELNELDENVTLYVLNVPMLTWANLVATEHPLLTLPTNLMFAETNSHPIVQMSWRGFGFGQENDLVSLGHTLFPEWLPFDKIGLVEFLNDQTGVVSTLHTGADDVQLSGLVQLLNGLEYLEQWPYPCNKIQNATMGFKIKTNMGDEEDFLFYFKGVCRALPFVPSGPKENRHGIPTRLYKIRKDAMDNGARNPDNSCYCKKKDDCLPEGLSDVSECFFGFSGALSYPHFYNANSSLLEAVDGLKPDPDVHETFIRANQDTGIITEFAYRVQLNLKFADIGGLKNCSPFSNMVLPMMWADIYMPSIPFKSKIDLFLLLRVQPITDILCSYGLIIFGVCLFYYARRALFRKSDVLLHLRLTRQDRSAATDTCQILMEIKDRETEELEVHTKLIITHDQ